MSKLGGIIVKNKTAGDSVLNSIIRQDKVTNDEIGKAIRKDINFALSFQTATDLMAALPLVPVNDRIYELVQDIQSGAFSDISSVEDAQDYWEQWVERTKEILRARKILVSNNNKKRLIRKSNK